MAKIWLITGTASGFGRLMTEKLLARGDTVVATVRRAGSLDDLLGRHGERLHVLHLDVADMAGPRTTVDAAFGAVGRIDVVVKGADAIIAAADANRPPLRLALGSAAYHNIARALEARRSALEEQRAVALATDVDG